MANTNITAKQLYKGLVAFLRNRFDLSQGKASEKQTTTEIRQNVTFSGANLWILIFAIMVASVGLDVNSPAVVIGAMLISPLMGPIMGIGLGVGINDFELILQALKNIAIAVLISVLTSALYFWISPLDQASSELLARTSPTLWDVLIAFFGGFAGIVAGSRSEKSNAIPGVAIATALMPPLCTAGYGLATGQWLYFFGAMYLFWINSVFISLSTYIVVRALRFRPKEFLDQEREKRVKRYVALFVVLTIIPSVYTAINVVQKTLFERHANEFIKKEFNFEGAQVINKYVEFNRKGSTIDVTLFGKPISPEMIQQVNSKLVNYNLQECDLHIMQNSTGQTGVDMATIELLNEKIKSGIIEELYEKNEDQIKTRDDRIKLLESEIVRYRSKELPMADISQEIKAIDQNVERISVAPAVISHTEEDTRDTTFLAYLQFSKKPSKEQVQMLEDWLRTRIKAENIKLIVE